MHSVHSLAFQFDLPVRQVQLHLKRLAPILKNQKGKNYKLGVFLTDQGLTIFKNFLQLVEMGIGKQEATDTLLIKYAKTNGVVAPYRET